MVGEERVQNHGKRIMALPTISKIESSKTPSWLAKNVKNKMGIKGESHNGPQAYYGFYRFIGSHYKLRPCDMFRVNTKKQRSLPLPHDRFPSTTGSPEERSAPKKRASEAEPPNFYPNVTAQEKHCR